MDRRRDAVELIERERQRKVPRLSQEKMAKDAGFTGTWWRQILKGEPPSKDVLVAAARVVGVEPEVRELLNLPPVQAQEQQDVKRAIRELRAMLDEAIAALEDIESRIQSQEKPVAG